MPAFAWSDPNDGLVARGGAIELGMGLTWMIQTGIDHVLRLPLSPAEKCRRRADLTSALTMLASVEAIDRFEMRSGDMLILDNQRMLHGRTAYRDSATATRRLIRAWLR